MKQYKKLIDKISVPDSKNPLYKAYYDYLQSKKAVDLAHRLQILGKSYCTIINESLPSDVVYEQGVKLYLERNGGCFITNNMKSDYVFYREKYGKDAMVERWNLELYRKYEAVRKAYINDDSTIIIETSFGIAVVNDINDVAGVVAYFLQTNHNRAKSNKTLFVWNESFVLLHTNGKMYAIETKVGDHVLGNDRIGLAAINDYPQLSIMKENIDYTLVDTQFREHNEVGYLDKVTNLLSKIV